MSSAVGVPLAARFTPVRELATLRRGLRLKVEETRPLCGSSRRPPRSGSYLADGRRPATYYQVFWHSQPLVNTKKTDH